VPELEAEDASGERRWRRERESDTGIRESTGQLCGEFKSFGRKRIDTGGLHYRKRINIHRL
jgi:hypothetical protein